MCRIARLLCICLSLLLLLSTAAFADNTVYTEGTLYYTVADECITITGYFGKAAEVTVPNVIAGMPVSVIAKGAFVGTNATVVYLPDTIMEVQEGAIGPGVKVVFASNTENPVEIGGTPESSEPAAPADTSSGPAAPSSGSQFSDTSASEETVPASGQSASVQEDEIEEYEVDVSDMPVDEPTLAAKPSQESSIEQQPGVESVTGEAEQAVVPSEPAASEGNSSALWITLCAALAVAAAALVFYFRKKKSTDESEKG